MAWARVAVQLHNTASPAGKASNYDIVMLLLCFHSVQPRMCCRAKSTPESGAGAKSARGSGK